MIGRTLACLLLVCAILTPRPVALAQPTITLAALHVPELDGPWVCTEYIGPGSTGITAYKECTIRRGRALSQLMLKEYSVSAIHIREADDIALLTYIPQWTSAMRDTRVAHSWLPDRVPPTFVLSVKGRHPRHGRLAVRERVGTFGSHVIVWTFLTNRDSDPAIRRAAEIWFEEARSDHFVSR